MNSAIGLLNSFPWKKQVKILLLVTIYISSCKPFSKIESETFHLIWYLISYLHTSWNWIYANGAFIAMHNFKKKREFLLLYCVLYLVEFFLFNWNTTFLGWMGGVWLRSLTEKDAKLMRLICVRLVHLVWLFTAQGADVFMKECSERKMPVLWSIDFKADKAEKNQKELVVSLNFSIMGRVRVYLGFSSWELLNNFYLGIANDCFKSKGDMLKCAFFSLWKQKLLHKCDAKTVLWKQKFRFYVLVFIACMTIMHRTNVCWMHTWLC